MPSAVGTTARSLKSRRTRRRSRPHEDAGTGGGVILLSSCLEVDAAVMSSTITTPSSSFSSSVSSGLRAEAPVFVPVTAVAAPVGHAPPRSTWTAERGTPPTRRHRHHDHDHRHRHHHHNHRRPTPGEDTPVYDRHRHGPILPAASASFDGRNPPIPSDPHPSPLDDYSAATATTTTTTAATTTATAANDSARIPTTTLWSHKVGGLRDRATATLVVVVGESLSTPLGKCPDEAAALHPLRSSRAGGGLQHHKKRIGPVPQHSPRIGASDDGNRDCVVGTDDPAHVQPVPPPPLLLWRGRGASSTNAAAADRWRDRWWDALQTLQDEAHRKKQQQQPLTQRWRERASPPHVPVSSPQSMPLHQTGGNARVETVVQASECYPAFSEGNDCSTPNAVLGTGTGSDHHQFPETFSSCSAGDPARLWEDAIDRDDAAALHRLVESRPREEIPLGLLVRVVQLDRPRLVRALLRGGGDGSIPFEEAVLRAAELGRDDCLEPLLLLRLDHRRYHAWTVRDDCGNAVLHMCSRPSTLRAALACLDRATSPSQRAKFIQATNDLGQTPFHRACQLGRDDLVSVWLSLLGNRALSKLWRQRDHARQTPLLAAVSSGSAETVTTLVLRRSNHLLDDTAASTSSGAGAGHDSPDPTPCPLAWAVRLRDVEMVRLLLEFHDLEAPDAASSHSSSSPDGHGYNLTEALRLAVAPSNGDQVLRIAGIVDSNVDEHKITDDYDGRLGLLRVLVDAGANPCAKSPASAPSAIVLAAHGGDADALGALLNARDQYLRRARVQRRRNQSCASNPNRSSRGRSRSRTQNSRQPSARPWWRA